MGGFTLLPIVGVYEELCEGAGLAGAVPAVRTVNYHRYSFQQGGPDEQRRLQDGLAVPGREGPRNLPINDSFAKVYRIHNS
jgi:hypothetical protein